MAIPASLANQLSIPVVGSPLFIISNPDLVIAQCKAGVIGSFPSLNARPLEQLDEWLTQINAELAAARKADPKAKIAPYAVNLIVHKSNNRLEEDLALCVKHKVPIVITSLGAREDVNNAIHSYGGIVLHDVINDRFARKAVEKGADGLIPVAAGAGSDLTWVGRRPSLPSDGEIVQRSNGDDQWRISLRFTKTRLASSGFASSTTAK